MSQAEQVDESPDEVVEPPVEQTQEVQAETPEAPAVEQAAEDDHVVVTFGDESPSSEEENEPAPQWVKDLRKSKREVDAENRRLREENARLTAPKQTDLGPKPTLESCNYDEDEYDRQNDAWKARKAEQDKVAERAAQEQQEAQKALQAKAQQYVEHKAALKVPDYDDAETAVAAELSVLQQNILVGAAENAALLAYALGKNPAELKKLASIKDPVQFAFAAGRLETKLNVKPRKAAPLPESIPRGSAPVNGSKDAARDKLVAEADRTGNRSKVIAYDREQRRRQAA